MPIELPMKAFTKVNSQQYIHNTKYIVNLYVCIAVCIYILCIAMSKNALQISFHCTTAMCLIVLDATFYTFIKHTNRLLYYVIVQLAVGNRQFPFFWRHKNSSHALQTWLICTWDVLSLTWLFYLVALTASLGEAINEGQPSLFLQGVNWRVNFIETYNGSS